MGRKFRLSVHRKNEERKVTSMIVSIPIELVTVSSTSERTRVVCITRDLIHAMRLKLYQNNQTADRPL